MVHYEDDASIGLKHIVAVVTIITLLAFGIAYFAYAMTQGRAGEFNQQPAIQSPAEPAPHSHV